MKDAVSRAAALAVVALASACASRVAAPPAAPQSTAGTAAVARAPGADPPADRDAAAGPPGAAEPRVVESVIADSGAGESVITNSSTRESVATDSGSAPPPSLAAPTEVLRVEGDLTGTGRATPIVLGSDGALVAGALRGRVELAEDGAEYVRRYGALHVVTVDRARRLRGVLFVLPTGDTEDPPNRYQVFVPVGAELRRALDVSIGTYGATPLRFPGDRTARYIEDGWAACGRAAAGRVRVPREELRYRLEADGQMRLRARVRTARIQDCTQLAACPYVDVADAAHGGRRRRVGEILRDVRGASAYTEQSLALPPAPAGALRVRLSEEKPEVTFLDGLYLEVDGARLAPRECASPAPGAYCASDHRAHVLREGDALEVTFDLPAAAAHPALHASGYYTPTPTAHVHGAARALIEARR